MSAALDESGITGEESFDFDFSEPSAQIPAAAPYGSLPIPTVGPGQIYVSKQGFSLKLYFKRHTAPLIIILFYDILYDLGSCGGLEYDIEVSKVN